ncbi:metallophosphoesterase [bacterium]|nr:metallophosphoesterase [bacterium]
MNASTPLFSAVAINDTHLRFGGHDFGAARAKLAAVVQRIADGRDGPPPQVLIQLGDLVEEPRRDHFEQAARFFEPLKSTRILHVPGNHDIGPDPDGAAAHPWLEALGGALNNACVLNGVMFITLYNARADATDETETVARNEWLRDLLQRYRATPKVIACHVPLVALRDPQQIEKSFGFLSWRSLDYRHTLRRMIESHRDSVIAVLSAHLHLSGHALVNGVHHLVASGPFSWPGDHLRLDFYRDRVVARMIPLEPFIDSNDIAPYPLRNSVHDRHGIEFTDAKHPAFEHYIAGNPDEREVILPR